MRDYAGAPPADVHPSFEVVMELRACDSPGGRIVQRADFYTTFEKAPWELNSVTSVPYFVTRSNRWPVRGLIPQKSAGMASKAIGGWRFDVLPIAARSPG